MAQANTAVAQRSDMVAAFHASMLQRARDLGNNDERSAQITESQGERILSADTEAEIWDADEGGTVQMRDVGNTEWEIRGFNPVESHRADIANSHGYYITCDATLLSADDGTLKSEGLVIGETYALQTGAELVVIKLRAFEAKGILPVRVFLKAIKTGSGNTMLKLRPLNKRLTTAEPVKGEVVES